MMRSFEIKILPFNDYKFDKIYDNLDVQIILEDGRIFSATFFTLENIKVLFEKNKISGECSNGLYLWTSDMLIVKTITMATIYDTINDMIKNNEIEFALTQINIDD